MVFKKFEILGVQGDLIVPGSNGLPLGPNAFLGATEGPCKMEVYGPGDAPFDIKSKDALFTSQTVQLLFGSSPQHPRPFAVIRSKFAKDLANDLETFVGKPINLVFRPGEDEKILKPDPYNEGWTLGLGVYRNEPWHFAGLFSDEETARAKSIDLGKGYSFAYGSNRNESDDFITTGYSEH